MTTVLFLVYGVLIGIAGTLLVITILDRAQDRKNLAYLANCDGFCQTACKNLEKCFSEHKDVDEALDELVNRYCTDCPISIALDYLDDDIIKEEKGDTQHANQNT